MNQLFVRCYSTHLYNNKNWQTSHQKMQYSQANQISHQKTFDYKSRSNNDAKAAYLQRIVQLIRNRFERRKHFPFTFCDVLESDFELDYNYPKELEDFDNWDFD